MKRKLGYFPFEAMDAQAAEVYLNRKAAAGWELGGIYLGYWAWFRRTTQKELHYCIDLYDETGRLDHKGYLQLCANEGWSLVTQVRQMAIFSSHPLCDPAPLHTRRQVEKGEWWRRVIRPRLQSNLLVLALLAVMSWLLWWMRYGKGGYSRPSSEMLCSTGTLFALLCVVLALIGLVWLPCAALRRRRRSQRTSDGGETLPPSAFWSRVRGTLAVLPRLLLLLYVLFTFLELMLPVLVGYRGYSAPSRRADMRQRPIVMAEEVGVDPAALYYSFRQPVWSLQVQGERYTEAAKVNGKIEFIYCNRYHCMTQGMAQRLVDALRWDIQQGNEPSLGMLTFQRVSLGFDESWATADGGFLLLRQGRTVVLTGVHFMDSAVPDLTVPERLETIRERLELE